MIKHLVTCTILFCLSLTAYAAEITKERLIFICDVNLRVHLLDTQNITDREQQKVQIDISAHSETEQIVEVKGSHDLWFFILVPKNNETYESKHVVRETKIDDDFFYFFESDRGLKEWIRGESVTPGVKAVNELSIDRRTGLVIGNATSVRSPRKDVSFKGFCNKVEGKALF